jgi:hypothetical protein
LGNADPKWFQQGSTYRIPFAVGGRFGPTPPIVKIEKPKTNTEVGVSSQKDDTASEKLVFPQTIDEAKAILKKFEAGSTAEEKTIDDNVCEHTLEDSAHLQNEKWPGTEQEEKDWCVLYGGRICLLIYYAAMSLSSSISTPK